MELLEKLSNCFYLFRPNRRHQRPPKKNCAIIKAEENQPCDPYSYHCKHGLTCKPNPSVGKNGERADTGADIDLRAQFQSDTQFSASSRYRQFGGSQFGVDYGQYGRRGQFGSQFGSQGGGLGLHSR